MNDTSCLRLQIRRQLGYFELERRLKSTYSVLFLVLLFALGTRFVTRPLDPAKLDALLAESALLRLIDFAGGGAYGNASIFAVSALFLVVSRTFMTLTITMLPLYRRMLGRLEGNDPWTARRMERHFVFIDVVAALALTFLLTNQQARAGVVAGDLRSLGTLMAFYFAGAVLLLLLMLAIEISGQADGLQAVLATGFALSTGRWLAEVARNASGLLLLLCIGTLAAALAGACLVKRYAAVNVPIRSPGPPRKYGEGALDITIGPEAPFGLDRITITAVVLLTAYAVDRFGGAAFALPLLAGCVLYVFVMTLTRSTHLYAVAAQMKGGGLYVENYRPGTQSGDEMVRLAKRPLSVEVAFVAIGLFLTQWMNARVLPVPAHPLTFVAMWALVELSVSMYMHWKWVWRRDATLSRAYRKYKPRPSTR